MKKSVNNNTTEEFEEIDYDSIDLSQYEGDFQSSRGQIHDEGDDMDSYTIMILGQMVNDVIDKLSDIEHYIDNDEYISTNKEKYAVIRRNIKNIISKMDVIWADE